MNRVDRQTADTARDCTTWPTPFYQRVQLLLEMQRNYAYLTGADRYWLWTGIYDEFADED